MAFPKLLTISKMGFMIAITKAPASIISANVKRNTISTPTALSSGRLAPFLDKNTEPYNARRKFFS